MATQRLPIIGSDLSTWGAVLNGYLSVAHNPNGTLANLQYNVVDFGADPTGVADSTIAIDAAMSAASSGARVFFPPGVYNHNGELLPLSNNHLQGSGRASIIRNTANVAVNGIKLANVSHVVITDLAIDGNRGNTAQPATQYLEYSGIWLTGCDDITIERCYIHDCWSSGILANGGCTNIIISDNRLFNCWDNQIYVRAGNLAPYTPCSNVTITGNICNGGGFSGIQVLGSSYVAITGNTCYSNGPTAAQGNGIGSEGGSYITIAGNVCHDNAIQGIQSRFTNEVGANLGSSHIVIANNIVYNQTSTNGDAGGIGINDTDDILVSGNLVYSNAFGINVNGGSGIGVNHCKLTNNTVRGNSNLGIRIQPGTGVEYIVEDCYVTDNANDGILVNGVAAIIKGCTLARQTGTHEGIHLQTGANGCLIDDCYIYDNTDNGVLIDSPVTGTIIRNTTFNNVTGTNQLRAVQEQAGAGPTTLINCQFLNQHNNLYVFNNAASVTIPPTPPALYDGDLGSNASGAGVLNTAYLVAVKLDAPIVLTGVRVRFAAGGSGHYDVGIYDASGANGVAGNLLAHAAATATSLVTATGTQTPAFTGGNITLQPGIYWLALWVDNATDTFNRGTGSGNMLVAQSGTTAGPLPALASSLTGLADTGTKPQLIGIRQGGWT